MRVRTVIQGVVQGVGFRPYLHRLAQEHGLAGQVANNGQGVVLELEGPAEAVAACLADLVPRKPPLAHVLRVETTEVAERGQRGFVILPSAGAAEPTALVPPDAAVCPDCLAELFDPADRRYRYPFINCTNCGPRYTILTGLPYDRPKTTMARFAMCPACVAEYADPADRRFHAQPNACPVCGPRLWLTDRAGRELPGDPVTLAAGFLAQGRLLAVKGLGGFHLACDAADELAVRRLRRRKRREEKPLAVMVQDLAAARRYAVLTQAEEDILASPARPILLARTRQVHGLAPAVAPGLKQLGLLLAYAPLHHLLLAQGPEALVMTSGNLSDEPIAIDNAEALERLKGVADFFLLHDRDIHHRADDSVVLASAGQPRLVRRARGFVLSPVRLNQDGPTVLALGPELKNTVCLARGEEALVSAHVGDLKEAATLAAHEETSARLLALAQAGPEALAVDLHPDYFSTRQADKFPGRPKVRVQHHVAHVLSAAAELGLDLPLLGLALDGTGLGVDQTVWGGELLLVTAQGFQRLGRLRPFRLPGGDAVVKQPWRTACGLLAQAYKAEWPRRLPRRLADYLAATGRGPVTLEAFSTMIRTGLNTPWCSSLGRLFDGLAVLAGLRHEAAYEGQVPLEFEGVADEAAEGAYAIPVAWQNGADGREIIDLDTRPLVRAVVDDVAAGAGPGAVSVRFHRGLAQALAQAAGLAAARTGIDRVALSGGCFLNRRLTTDLLNILDQSGLRGCPQRDLPCADGGLSLGQALAARLALAAGRPEMWAAEMEG